MQNFMIVGQFEVLQPKQQEFDAYQGYLQALASYWQARAELAKAVSTRLPSAAQIAIAGIEPEVLIAPKDVGTPQGSPMARDAADSMPGMEMNGAKGMGGVAGKGHPGHDWGSTGAAPTEGSPAGHVMHKMDQNSMEHMGHGAPRSEPDEGHVVCEEIKSADPKDPLTRALVRKCDKLQKSKSGVRAQDPSNSKEAP